jgi:CheY-like chemotaxis protein
MPDVQEAIRMFQEKRTVLSVDDDPVNQMVILTLFEGEGYTVLQAMDGKQALDTLEKTRGDPPDVVVLDIMMQNMSGYSALDQMKLDHPADLPVIFLSAKTSVADKVEGLKHLCHDYQPKPFEKDELIARAKAFIVLRNLRKLETAKAAQLESLYSSAPQSVIDKFKAGPTVINEKFNNVNMMDLYMPFTFLERNLECAIQYLSSLYTLLRDLVPTFPPGTIKMAAISGSGFRLTYSINDGKDISSDILSKYNELAANFEFKTVKPFTVTHKTGPCAGTMIEGQFKYISEHVYFSGPPIQEDEKKKPTQQSSDQILESSPETVQREFVDAETDNPWYDFEAMLAARVASVPPLPWIKKINEKPKIIVVEEMDLNDISEIFLLRSRITFLEHQKGVTKPWKERQEAEAAAAAALANM